jgi:hypothetical protein
MNDEAVAVVGSLTTSTLDFYRGLPNILEAVVDLASLCFQTPI